MNIKIGEITTILLAMTFMLGSSLTYASFSYDELTKEDPYHVGKITYHRKLACKSCPLSDTVIDASMYKSIVERINNDEQLTSLLNEKERVAVSQYLEYLFTPR